MSGTTAGPIATIARYAGWLPMTSADELTAVLFFHWVMATIHQKLGHSAHDPDK